MATNATPAQTNPQQQEWVDLQSTYDGIVARVTAASGRGDVNDAQWTNFLTLGAAVQAAFNQGNLTLAKTAVNTLSTTADAVVGTASGAPAPQPAPAPAPPAPAPVPAPPAPQPTPAPPAPAPAPGAPAPTGDPLMDAILNVGHSVDQLGTSMKDVTDELRRDVDQNTQNIGNLDERVSVLENRSILPILVGAGVAAATWIIWTVIFGVIITNSFAMATLTGAGVGIGVGMITFAIMLFIAHRRTRRQALAPTGGTPTPTNPAPAPAPASN